VTSTTGKCGPRTGECGRRIGRPARTVLNTILFFGPVRSAHSAPSPLRSVWSQRDRNNQELVVVVGTIHPPAGWPAGPAPTMRTLGTLARSSFSVVAGLEKPVVVLPSWKLFGQPARGTFCSSRCLHTYCCRTCRCTVHGLPLRHHDDDHNNGEPLQVTAVARSRCSSR
jgi:hypothetical protein